MRENKLSLTEDRLRSIRAIFIEFPELREPAIHFLLEQAEPLGPAQADAVEQAFMPVLEELGRALARLGDMGLTAKPEFNAGKGYLLVQVKPASEEKMVKRSP